MTTPTTTSTTMPSTNPLPTTTTTTFQTTTTTIADTTNTIRSTSTNPPIITTRTPIRRPSTTSPPTTVTTTEAPPVSSTAGVRRQAVPVNTETQPNIYMYSSRHIIGGHRRTDIYDVNACYKFCMEKSVTCKAFDFDGSRNQCWIHSSYSACNPLVPKYNVTHYSFIECGKVILTFSENTHKSNIRRILQKLEYFQISDSR